MRWADKAINLIDNSGKGYGQILESKKPQKAIELAVKRMIPKGPLGREQLKKLYIYTGENHPHEAQKPQLVDISVMNSKNKRDVK